MQSLELKSAPTHGAKPEDLNPAKFKQRLEAARYLTGHKTIMELYAGAGS